MLTPEVKYSSYPITAPLSTPPRLFIVGKLSIGGIKNLAEGLHFSRRLRVIPIPDLNTRLILLTILFQDIFSLKLAKVY